MCYPHELDKVEGEIEKEQAPESTEHPAAQGPKVLIVVEGGLVQAVYANQPMDVALLDQAVSDFADDVLLPLCLDSTDQAGYDAAALRALQNQAYHEKCR